MTKAIAQDFQSTRAEYRTWKEWYNDVTDPGYYDTDDLTTARLAYLAKTFRPRLRGKTAKLRPCTPPCTNNASKKNLPLQIRCYVGPRNLPTLGLRRPIMARVWRVIQTPSSWPWSKTDAAKCLVLIVLKSWRSMTIVALNVATKGIRSAINWSSTTPYHYATVATTTRVWCLFVQIATPTKAIWSV